MSKTSNITARHAGVALRKRIGKTTGSASDLVLAGLGGIANFFAGLATGNEIQAPAPKQRARKPVAKAKPAVAAEPVAAKPRVSKAKTA